MAEKSLEMVVKARDETRAALKSSRENAKRTERQFEKLDNQVKKMRKQRAGTRIKQDEQLNNQQMRMLQRRIDLGDEAAKVEKRRIEINQQFQKERRQLLKIVRSEQSSQQQRMRAQRQLRELEEDRTRQLNQLNQAQRRTGKTASTAGSKIRGMIGGFAGLAGVAATVRAVEQSIRRLRQEAVSFNDQLRPLVAVGDNAGNIEALRKEVLDLSSAFGKSRQEIITAQQQVQTAASNLDREMRENLLKTSLRLSNLYGSQLPAQLNLATRTMQIYGGELGSVSQAQAKLALIADRSAAGMKGLADELPDLLDMARNAELNFNELASAFIVASRNGGKLSSVSEGMETLMERLNETLPNGTRLTGDFIEKLKQLQSFSKQQRIELLGESAKTAKNLIDNIDEVRSAMKRLESETSEIGDKLAKRLSDSATNFAQALKGLQQANKNAALATTSGSNRIQNQAIGEELAKRGINETFLAPLPDFAKTKLAQLDNLAGLGTGALKFQGAIERAKTLAEQGRLQRAQQFLDIAERSNQVNPNLLQQLAPNSGQVVKEAKKTVEDVQSTINERRREKAEEERKQRQKEQREQFVKTFIDPLKSTAQDVAQRLKSGAQEVGSAIAQRIEQNNVRFGREGFVRFSGPQEKLTSENDQRVDFVSGRQLEAKKALEEQRRQILRQRANLGSEQAQQKLERLRIKDEFEAQRRRLQQIVRDPGLTDQQRAQAREQLSRLDQLKQRRLAAVGKDDTDKAGDGPGRAPQAFSQTQAARLIFDAQKKADSPQQKTADNTKQMLEKLDELIETVGEQTGLSDALEVFQA